MGPHVVKEIVMLHDGTVDVESAEGVGSTFHIHLPLHQHFQSVSDDDANVS